MWTVTRAMENTPTLNKTDKTLESYNRKKNTIKWKVQYTKTIKITNSWICTRSSKYRKLG